MSKRAILSVYDKANLEHLARELVALGWELIASGGTARQLQAIGLAVIEVATLTGAPEILGGRVKTLHPVIHGGILARDIPSDQADLVAQQIGMIDMVVCNLYPFTETVANPNVTLSEAIEQIDIGGVTLLRAAAKNFDRVVVLCDSADYIPTLSQLHTNDTVDYPTRLQLATKAFAHTRDYDTAITAYLVDQLPAK